MKIVRDSVQWAIFEYLPTPKAVFIGLFLSLFLTTGNLNAQNEFSGSLGAGKYELVNVGMQWRFGKKSSISANVGTNFGADDKQLYAVGLTFTQVFQKSLLNWIVKPGYSIGTVYWTQDDELYYFETLSFPVMVLAEYPITTYITARIEGGVVFSQNLISDRKQNTTAGFPDRFDENYQLSIIYKFRHHEK